MTGPTDLPAILGTGCGQVATGRNPEQKQNWGVLWSDLMLGGVVCGSVVDGKGVLILLLVLFIYPGAGWLDRGLDESIDLG